ncbi:MAG: hypothetical protein DMG40_11510 [Acidobacteria bacterium]|nr:MAG: hypothetical protein DMG40_11510 [Acidobacteriota bacterium]
MALLTQRVGAILLISLLFSCVLILPGCPRHPATWTPQPPYGTTTGAKDFDLTSPGSDSNGSPDNPRWAPQIQKPQNLPPTVDSDCKKKNVQPYQGACTDQSKYLVEDTGAGITGALCSLFGDSSSINGHADWTVASGQGAVGWLNFADDWDYNLLLVPDNENGLTGNNNELSHNDGRYIEVEFDSRELESRFGTQWWEDFARLASEGAASGDYSTVENHLHPGPGLAYGVIYGIFGIDCEHGCRSEVHPAYAVAIQVDESKGNNTWAIFARNWGDEGFCSHLDHQLDVASTGQAIHLVLPYKSTAGPIVKSQEVASSIPQLSQCPAYNFVPDRGEEITIPLPPPGGQGLTEVIVQFTWPDAASSVEYKKVEKENLLQMLTTRKSEATKTSPAESSEEHVGRLFRYFNQGKGLTAAGFGTNVFPRFSAKMTAAQQSATSLKVFQEKNARLSCPVPEAASAAAQGAAKTPPAAGQLPPLPVHAAKQVWDRAAVAYFCAAYEVSGKKLPPGERPDLGKRLDKLCTDKRLKP